MIGDEDMQNGPIHLIKVAVDSVVPVSFEEPPDPSVELLDGDTLPEGDSEGDD